MPSSHDSSIYLPLPTIINYYMQTAKNMTFFYRVILYIQLSRSLLGFYPAAAGHPLKKHSTYIYVYAFIIDTGTSTYIHGSAVWAAQRDAIINQSNLISRAKYEY